MLKDNLRMKRVKQIKLVFLIAIFRLTIPTCRFGLSLGFEALGIGTAVGTALVFAVIPAAFWEVKATAYVRGGRVGGVWCVTIPEVGVRVECAFALGVDGGVGVFGCASIPEFFLGVKVS